MSEGAKDVRHCLEMEIVSLSVSTASNSSRKQGKRCVAYGCSNCSTNCTMSMLSLPGKMPSEKERFSPLQKSWIDFINKRRQFETKKLQNLTNR